MRARFTSPAAEPSVTTQPKPTLRTGAGADNRIVYVVLFALLAYLCGIVAADAAFPRRVVYLRFWTVFAVGAFAMAPSTVLLPDPQVALLHIANAPPRKLLAHQLRRWMPVVLLFTLPAVMIAYFDPVTTGEELGGKTLYLITTLLITAGAGFYGFAQYMVIGKRSQEWQEGARGGWYRWLSENSPLTYTGLPLGMVPAMFATQHVFLVGMAALLASAWLVPNVGLAVSWVPGLLLVLIGLVRLHLLARRFDAHFYRTNALYEEVFRRAGGVRASDRDPIPYKAVYWVPARWKPHVWAALRQLDRRLPLGRFVFLGHAVLWVLFYQEAGPGAIAAYLLLLSLVQNATVLLTARPDMAPPLFNLRLQRPGGWVLTRFFVNLRWALPFVLSLSAVALLTQGRSVTLEWANVVSWSLVNVAVALAAAWLATRSAEPPYLTRYA